MHRHTYRKPDGRVLHLYARTAFPPLDPTSIPNPPGSLAPARPHLRFHPVRREWVLYAAHRQDRTFLPPVEFDPLAPTLSPDAPTELPAGGWEVAVFENRFPSLAADPGPPPSIDGAETAPGNGACEVVVFAQSGTTSLAELDPDHIALILAVLGERTRMLADRGDIRHVLPFENRGAEMGVTLHHPHGQIYAYPFVPPLQLRALESFEAHAVDTGEALTVTLARRERDAGTRVIASRDGAVAFVPPFARYPYEVWVAPTDPTPRLGDLAPALCRDVARTLSEVLRRYDRLWGRPMPYLMSFQQAPVDAAHPSWSLWIEITPGLRTATKLKYLAGTELAAGAFANDALPEASAAALRAVVL